MKKWLRCRLVVTAIVLTALNASGQKIVLQRYKEFTNYSSSSALEWHKGRLYVMGDDAPSLLVLDQNFKEKKRVKIFDYNSQRIPYAQKPDIESAFIRQKGSGKELWLLPSFSNAVRNKSVRISLNKKKLQPEIKTSSLKTASLPQTNIEGAAVIGNKLILANRANTQHREHFLLVFPADGDSLLGTPERTIQVSLPTNNPVGISGMHYLAARDILLMTISTEITASATADGAIGDAYLAIIPNAKMQVGQNKTIRVEALINLSSALKTGKPMKIESVTAYKPLGRKIRLIMAADNDNGTSHLFRFSLKLARPVPTR